MDASDTGQHDLRVEINHRGDTPATCRVWRNDVLIFDGADRSATLRVDSTATPHTVAALARALSEPDWSMTACICCGQNSTAFIGVFAEAVGGRLRAVAWCDKDECARDREKTPSALVVPTLEPAVTP